MFNGTIGPRWSLSDKNVAIKAPIGRFGGEWVELAASLRHPAVIVDGSEALASVTPIVTFTPLSTFAGKLEGSRTNCGFESGISDNLIDFSSESLNTLQIDLTGDSRSTIDHPLWLIEHFNCMDIVLESIIIQILQKWLQAIVDVGILLVRILNHILAVVGVYAFEREHREDDFEVVLFHFCEEIVGVVHELIVVGFEFT